MEASGTEPRSTAAATDSTPPQRKSYQGSKGYIKIFSSSRRRFRIFIPQKADEKDKNPSGNTLGGRIAVEAELIIPPA